MKEVSGHTFERPMYIWLLPSHPEKALHRDGCFSEKKNGKNNTDTNDEKVDDLLRIALNIQYKGVRYSSRRCNDNDHLFKQAVRERQANPGFSYRWYEMDDQSGKRWLSSRPIWRPEFISKW